MPPKRPKPPAALTAAARCPLVAPLARGARTIGRPRANISVRRVLSIGPSLSMALLIAVGHLGRVPLRQRLPRRALCRAPRRRPPRGAGRARWRVLHPRRVERRSPAALIVLGKLQVEALTVHPDG